jgi:hypothetical protein
MHARLDELVRLLEARRALVLEAVAAAGNPTPRAGAWSVPEVVDHLRIVETGVSKLLHVQLSRSPRPLPQEMSTESVAHLLDHVRLDDRHRRIVAPEAVRPRTGLSLDEAMAGLVSSREQLLRTLDEANGVALSHFTWPHPLLGPFDLYQWILFVGLHERRHARQIEEMASS